jgi:hypothetical protein
MDTIHPASEFHLFPWEQILKGPVPDPNTWSFGRGGFPVPDSMWSIKVFKPKEQQSDPMGVDCDVWILPPMLQYMIVTLREWAKEDLRRSIRCYVEGAVKLINPDPPSPPDKME